DDTGADCLSRNLPLETHILCFRSFWRREICEVAVWLKVQKCFTEGVFREKRTVRFLVRQCGARDERINSSAPVPTISSREGDHAEPTNGDSHVAFHRY